MNLEYWICLRSDLSLRIGLLEADKRDLDIAGDRERIAARDLVEEREIERDGSRMSSIQERDCVITPFGIVYQAQLVASWLV